MTRRLEAGPLLVTLGALLLLVSLFLNWFTGEITAWEGVRGLGPRAVRARARGDRRRARADDAGRRADRPAVPAGGRRRDGGHRGVADPRSAAGRAGQDPDTGAWLALGAALIVMCAGAVLTFGRVHLVAHRRGARGAEHVAAVDARGPADPTTDNIPVVAARDERSPSGAAGQAAVRP